MNIYNIYITELLLLLPTVASLRIDILIIKQVMNILKQ